MKKTFELATEDIQKIILSLVLNDVSKKVMTDEDADRLSDMFCAINCMCGPGNNYTVTLEVTA